MVVTRITALYKSKAYDQYAEIARGPNGKNGRNRPHMMDFTV